MRSYFFAIALGATLVDSKAIAQCQDACASPDGGRLTLGLSLHAQPVQDGQWFTWVDVGLAEDEVVGPAFAPVFVATIRGPADGGAGYIWREHVGPVPLAGPMVLQSFALGDDGYVHDGGVVNSFWQMQTYLFLGDNTITLTATLPSGCKAESAPVRVTFDAGSLVVYPAPSTPTPPAPSTPTPPAPSKPGQHSSPSNSVTPSYANSSSCSMTSGGAPSFVPLMMMLAWLGRRAKRPVTLSTDRGHV